MEMRQSWVNLRRLFMGALSLSLALGLIVNQFFLQTEAAQLGTRSIAISTSQPSQIANHIFSFDTVTSGNIGSIAFQYCSNSPLAGTACTAPAGLNVLSAVIISQSGATGFSVDPSTTQNRLVISRPSAFAGAGTLSYGFSNITNPSTANQSTYVRISTYMSSNGSGASTDQGAVVFALSVGIGVGGFVPPRLVLCVGAVVALNCSNQSNNIQDLGILSPSSTGFTSTQFSVGTNDPGGYNVYVYGPTLTSGNNIIPSSSSPRVSLRNTAQFGMNLVANSLPPVGANPIGAGTGVVSGGYNSPNLYQFNSGDLVASSIFSTDYNLFTVSYIANITSSQPPGIYATTMTYVGVVAF